MKFVVFIIFVKFLLGNGLSFSEEVQKSFPTVITSLGAIEGYYKTSKNGRLFRAFEGIPYAQRPIGDRRFGVPKPISSWTSVLMAKQFSPPCLQYNRSSSDPTNPVRGAEDCLYMNIYTPIMNHSDCKADESSSNLLPVIFFIHGGSFQRGSGSEYGPGFLLDRDVILVIINYRLGVMGFLSTEDEIVPGNMGLKDQVIALRWVKDHIQSFGGDPSRILITGQSAGGASVQYHYLTNLTAGLFQGGLSISGTSFNCWAQTENSLEKVKKLATIVGCSTANIQCMVNCLRAKPAEQIVRAVGEFRSSANIPPSPFGPVVEKGGGEFTFIDRSPIDIITSGDAQDLPWITSDVSEEGIVDVSNFIANETLLKELDRDWIKIAPHLLDYNYTIPKSDHARVARLIRRRYLGSRQIDESTVKQIIELVGNRIFKGAHSTSELNTGSEENFGVAHKDDLAYVFEIGVDTTTTPKDRAIQKKLIDLWVSFATDLTPKVGVEWTALNGRTEKLNYLHIAGPSEIRMESSRNFGDKNFWNSIGFQENN